MTLSSVTTFCPGHLSGYFKKIQGGSAASTGSIGAGIVISEGVMATVTSADVTSICIRQKDGSGHVRDIATGSELIADILKKCGVTAAVTTECTLPVSAGFGLSAAALLATLTAANRLFDLGLTRHDIASRAHETEVIHRTGLGDVAACQGGGRVERFGPGIDGRIERTYDLAEPLYAFSFGPIPSPSVLSSPEYLDRIASAFPISPSLDLPGFFSNANAFAERSCLVTPEVREVLTVFRQENVPAAMTMLGNGVFGYGSRARDILRQFGIPAELFMARSGTRILEEQP
jgi:pantoate kinase